MKRNICVVVTARPSYSRIRTALRAIQAHPDLELQVVAAASALLERYGHAVRLLEQDGFPIHARVHMVIEGENPLTMAKTTGLGLLELATVFDNLRPDVILTIADRYETLATAIAAAYMNVPLVHIQGGEVTGSIDEKVRHAVTKLADYHFVATCKAAERVERMGERADRVFVTGCPSIDLAAEALEHPGLDFDPITKYGGVGSNLRLREGYLVVIQHPVTTQYAEARHQVEETLRAVQDLGWPTLWFWPNVDAGSDGTSKGIRSFREIHRPQNIHFFKNMEGHDFIRLVRGCRCFVGNSSAGIRECAFLGVPAVNIGDRQAGRERVENVLDAPHQREAIRAAVERQIQHGPFPASSLYGDGRAGERMAELLAGIELVCEKKLSY